MSNVVPFKKTGKYMSKDVSIDLGTIDAPLLDHRKWQCGSCHDSTTFHIWCDGVVACAECGAETAGLIAKLDEQ